MKRNLLLILLTGVMAVSCMIVLSACNFGGFGSTHNHVFSAEWSYNAGYHWHACESDCGEQKDLAKHTWENGVCTVCKANSNLLNNFEYKLSDDGTYYIISKYIGGDEEVIIPSECGGIPVKNIARHAFYQCDSIRSVVIPGSVTSIEWSAFKSCGSLESVTIGNGVKSIGEEAFLGCVSLEDIMLPDSLTNIGNAAFVSCSSLESIVIPDSVTSIEQRAFQGCTSLTSIEIPNSVTRIGNEIFYDCDSLERISIPFVGENADGNGATYFGYLFAPTNNSVPSSLKEVVVTGGTNIDSAAFKMCDSLESVTIPEGVTSIGEEAFSFCERLTAVTIPDSVESIGAFAFDNCSSLTSIAIPEGVTSIEEETFGSCSRLANIVLPDSVESIGAFAFNNCSSLTSIAIPESVTSIGKGAFAHCTGLTAVTIPDKVENIENSAFGDCWGLTSITIGTNVTNIGDEAFENCYKLVEIYNRSRLNIAFGNKDNSQLTEYARNIYTEEGSSCLTDTADGYRFIYDDGKAYLIGYYGTETAISLPESFIAYDATQITEYGIYSYAFSDYNQKTLKSVTVPDSVTSIGNYAFKGCRELTSVTIGNGVTNIRLGTFSDCRSLANVTIPGSVTSIESQVFYGCSSLASITIPDSVTSIGYSAFENCSSLTNIVIPDSVKSIESQVFYGCSSLASITIPDSVTSIGYSAFEKCKSLASVTIPDSVKSIESRAFYGCSSLASITISDGMPSIGTDAFENCPVETATIPADVIEYVPKDKLKTVVITSGERLRLAAFENCGSLESVVISEGVRSIGDNAFKNCNSLTNIIIPNSIINIGSSVFDGCSSLAYNEYDNACYLGNESNPYRILIKAKDSSITSVTVNKNTGLIDGNAFSGCGSLASVTIPNGGMNIEFGAFENCPVETATIPADVIRHIPKDKLKTVVITSGTSILESAFENCGALASVTIPEGVTSIGDNAFKNCNSLTSITVPGSITSIGKQVFDGCGSLAYNEYDNACYLGNESNPYLILIKAKDSSIISVEINNKTKFIYGNAFSGCGALARVTIPVSVKNIGNNAFYGCGSLERIDYSGTAEQWNSVSKGDDWDGNTGNYTVYCSEDTVIRN